MNVKGHGQPSQEMVSIMKITQSVVGQVVVLKALQSTSWEAAQALLTKYLALPAFYE